MERTTTEQMKENVAVDLGKLLFELMTGVSNDVDFDGAEYGEYRGIRWMMRPVGGWYCAYVEVPFDTNTPEFVCHGGVTWGDYAPKGHFNSEPCLSWPKGSPEGLGDCRKGFKIIGWDYNHDFDGRVVKENVIQDVRVAIDTMLGGEEDGQSVHND